MPTFNQDTLKLVHENTDFLEEIVTNEFSQVALMSIEPGSDIGEEVHEVDQVLVIVEGTGEAVLNRQHSPVRANSLVVVPAGTRHNCQHRQRAVEAVHPVRPTGESPGHTVRDEGGSRGRRGRGGREPGTFLPKWIVPEV